MFGKITAILGSETDDELFTVLKDVLSSYNAIVEEKSFHVVGSQEIKTWEALLGSQKLKIVSETYEGLSIKGPSKLVNEIAAKVDLHLA
tara:strand:+ start:2096 stop:2362 length:267 start_codon:yes stop_codon:yes gene_type:complete